MQIATGPAGSRPGWAVIQQIDAVFVAGCRRSFCSYYQAISFLGELEYALDGVPEISVVVDSP